MEKDFEIWYEKEYGKNSDPKKVVSIGFRPHYRVFINQHIVFRYGVYLKYFKGIEKEAWIMPDTEFELGTIGWFLMMNDEEIGYIEGDNMEEAQRTLVKTILEK